MTYQAILVASGLLLLAYGIERLGRVTGIPSVVALIAVGFASKPLLVALDMPLSGLDAAVPVLGTVGLVLIVLEGAFELELRRDRVGLALGAAASAVVGFALLGTVFALLAIAALGLRPADGVLLAIPLAVISSAVAIPGSAFLPPRAREFVVYESSISDIVGILVFFAVLDSDGTLAGVASTLAFSGTGSVLLGALCTMALTALLVRLDGQVRSIPLLAALFALYAGGKLLHLSPLIMVLMFGFVLNSPTLLAWLGPRDTPDIAQRHDARVREFKALAAELTFAVRGFFFILLGYWTDLASLASLPAWAGAALALAIVFGSRAGLLRLARHPLAGPLTWIAPRGLITVLLYLAAREAVAAPAFMDGMVMLVVLVSALAMGAGRMRRAGSTP